MTQSKAELTTDKQILYLVQWFAEFSDFQRADFLAEHLLPLYGAFLASKVLAEVPNGTNNEEPITNGISSLDLDQKPPSIFQCRMKLFQDWYAGWTEPERLELLLRLRNIDSAFLSEFYRVFLHGRSISSYDQFLDVKTSDEELLTRLDINEKVFESKLPEVVLSRSAFPPAFTSEETVQKDSTPDLLHDVVGIKDAMGSDEEQSLEARLEACEQPDEEIQEVIMTDVEQQPEQPEAIQQAEEQQPAQPAQEEEAQQPSAQPESESQPEAQQPEQPEGEVVPATEQLIELDSPEDDQQPIIVVSSPVTTSVVIVPDLVA